MGPLPSLTTDRLTLLACPPEVARAALDPDPSLLTALTGARPAPGWPLPDLRAYLPAWADLVAADPGRLTWGVWLILHRDQGLLIGDAGFQGRPDRTRTVELSCGILPPWRCLGFGTEACQALIEDARERAGIWTVIAQAEWGDLAAARMLRRLGLEPAERQGDVELWRGQV